jgi:eukaryotic-like serine/threonine-protein kinase
MVLRATRGDCSESRLRSFLDEKLSEPENARLVDHLDSCSSCQRQIEHLAAGSRMWSELQHLNSRPMTDRERAAIGMETASRGSQTPSSPEEIASLDFLGPPSAAGSLGRLGPYDVTEVLGRGGFGIVLKAFDPALGRAVAMKVLSPQLASSAAARSRFGREARAAAAVVHEHVIAIHAVDSANGLPYLVMPYIAGRSLQQRVDREGPLDAKEVLRIGLQTAQGLAAAHEQGLVHRDVKPANILLENGVERVKLSDFGLARAVDDASLTQSGTVAGTPQYMSPEQARGEAVDHRSDLFGLGSVLYFMCTGHPPFRASSTPAVLRRVSDDKPRPLREINPDVPKALAQVVERLHAKLPAGRLQTASDVADILKRQLACLQRSEPLPSIRPLPFWSFAKRSRTKTGTAVVLSSIVVLGLVFAGAGTRISAYAWPKSNVNPALTSFASGASTRAQNPAADQVSDDHRIIGSGKAATKSWDLADFSTVKVVAPFHVEISQGARFKVTTSADDNVIEHVQVVKEGSTLKLGLEPGKSYQLKESLKAEITLPVLKGLDLGSASDTNLKGFRSSEDLTVTLGGASTLSGAIEAAGVNFDLGGASTLSLTGSAKSANIVGHGAARLKLAEFPLQRCGIELSGASNARLTVKSERPFSAKLSGASVLEGSVGAKELDLHLNGSSRASLTGSATDAKLSLDSASQAKLAEFSVNAKTLTLSVNGASSADLRGTAETAVLIGGGASHLRLSGLTVKGADVKLSGASSAAVSVSELLKYDLQSVSHLRYSGEPTKLTGHKSGGASISRTN